MNSQQFLLGLDFEVTSLDEKIPTEVGYMLVESTTWRTIRANSFLINLGGSLDEKAADIAGLTKEMLTEYGQSGAMLATSVSDLTSAYLACDYIVAHNHKFDKQVLSKLLKAMQADKILDDDPKPWIDTMIDVPYPDRISSRGLTALAAEHDILNPFPHSALFDVAVMMKLLSRYDGKLPEILDRAESPLVRIKAIVSYDDRQLAKDQRFFWMPAKKIWHKEIRMSDFSFHENKAHSAGFGISIVEYL